MSRNQPHAETRHSVLRAMDLPEYRPCDQSRGAGRVQCGGSRLPERGRTRELAVARTVTVISPRRAMTVQPVQQRIELLIIPEQLRSRPLAAAELGDLGTVAAG